jgi:hypothetical protein
MSFCFAQFSFILEKKRILHMESYVSHSHVCHLFRLDIFRHCFIYRYIEMKATYHLTISYARNCSEHHFANLIVNLELFCYLFHYTGFVNEIFYYYLCPSSCPISGSCMIGSCLFVSFIFFSVEPGFD